MFELVFDWLAVLEISEILIKYPIFRHFFNTLTSKTKIELNTHCSCLSVYHKVMGRNTSGLVAHARNFRQFMKEKIDSSVSKIEY